MNDIKKPKSSTSLGQQELDKAQDNFDQFEKSLQEMTLDRMNETPKQEVEPQTKIAQADIADSKDIYIKPLRTISSKEKFNEQYRNDYNFAKEYVYAIAENKEIIGEELHFWTKKFPGTPAEEWKVPVNKPVWMPRYVAEQIKACNYHRFVMQNQSIGLDGMANYYGNMAVDTTIQRLDCVPATKKRSIFMGSTTF